ncbi:hypothetical protein KIH13_16835 [Pseudomonas viridiflava]|nr:hypothetical protein KIH13_16835 [Pseudomonas viridiflava]
MKEIVIAFLVLWSFAVHAETKTFKLKPDFNGVSQVKFTTESASGYDVLKGTLTNSAGQNYSVPDVCEPEGGVAEISDAYVVDGKARYFLFTCFWSVSHAGIGLKGTQYETYIYTGSSLGSLNKELALGQFFRITKEALRTVSIAMRGMLRAILLAKNCLNWKQEKQQTRLNWPMRSLWLD